MFAEVRRKSRLIYDGIVIEIARFAVEEESRAGQIRGTAVKKVVTPMRASGVELLPRSVGHAPVRVKVSSAPPSPQRANHLSVQQHLTQLRSRLGTGCLLLLADRHSKSITAAACPFTSHSRSAASSPPFALRPSAIRFLRHWSPERLKIVPNARIRPSIIAHPILLLYPIVARWFIYLFCWSIFLAFAIIHTMNT